MLRSGPKYHLLMVTYECINSMRNSKPCLRDPLLQEGRLLYRKMPIISNKKRVKQCIFVAGFSCPADWKYPFKCPQGINTNKTAACCYDNGPNCCEPGGRRCSDGGSSQRDYCPRPTDNKKLKYCCTKGGQPSCCKSSGVCTKAR